MQEWTKRLEGLMDSGRKLAGVSGKQASRLAREFGGKWLPSGMRGLASGLSDASKALNKGAKKLRKNVKTFAEPSNPEPRLAPVPVRANRR